MMTAPACHSAASPEKPAAKTIAVVDDDALTRESLGALLEACGYAVQSFGSGAEFTLAGSCLIQPRRPAQRR